MEQLQFSRDTEILYQGSFVHGDTLKPEAPPLYPTTAFLMDDLDMLHAVDSVGGYSYRCTQRGYHQRRGGRG